MLRAFQRFLFNVCQDGRLAMLPPHLANVICSRRQMAPTFKANRAFPITVPVG